MTPRIARLFARTLLPCVVAACFWGCDGEMRRDSGGGQGDGGNPGQPADDGGVDGRTGHDGDGGCADAADGACPAARDAD